MSAINYTLDTTKVFSGTNGSKTPENTAAAIEPQQAQLDQGGPTPRADRFDAEQVRDASPSSARTFLGGSGAAPQCPGDEGVAATTNADALTDDQYAAANARRLLLVQAAPLLNAGVTDRDTARALGLSASKLSLLLNLAPAPATAPMTSRAKCARLLALPVHRLAPPAPKYRGSDFAPLLQVPGIVAELNRLYAATLGASCAQATNDRRTGSMALTLKRLGDFHLVPPALAEKLRGGSQPKPLVQFLKNAWTPEMEAKFRGQKHYNAATVAGRRDLTEELADGSMVPLQPGKVWVFDDMSSNLPFWFELDADAALGVADKSIRQLIERHGCAMGRQGLYAWDWASGAWLGVDLVGRIRDAYRASDILRFIRKLVLIYGKPDKIVLERGTWMSKAISGWSLRGETGDGESLVEIERGWDLPEMAGDERARITDGIRAIGVEIIYAYTSRGKPIEGAFDYLQSIVPTLCEPGEAMNIGRHAGEFEWSAKAHLRAGSGVRHPRDLRFVHIDRLADLTLQAMAWDGRHDKARRNGKPLEILAAQLNHFPLPRPTHRDMAVFLPEKRSALVRGGFINPQVDGVPLQFGNAEIFAQIGDGARVDYAFDPDEPTLGAAIYDVNGFLCWADFIPAGPVISARDRSAEAGPQYLKRYKAAHRTSFRALDLKSLRPVAIAERRDGAGNVATVTRGATPQGGDEGVAATNRGEATAVAPQRVGLRSGLLSPSTPEQFSRQSDRWSKQAERARQLRELQEA